MLEVLILWNVFFDFPYGPAFCLWFYVWVKLLFDDSVHGSAFFFMILCMCQLSVSDFVYVSAFCFWFCVCASFLFYEQNGKLFNDATTTTRNISTKVLVTDVTLTIRGVIKMGFLQWLVIRRPCGNSFKPVPVCPSETGFLSPPPNHDTNALPPIAIHWCQGIVGLFFRPIGPSDETVSEQSVRSLSGLPGIIHPVWKPCD